MYPIAFSNQLISQMTPQRKLILYFIDTGFATDQYNLTKHLDRSAYFPANITQNLSFLLAEKMIGRIKSNNNTLLLSYSATDKGRTYLDTFFEEDEIYHFADGYSNPDFMREIARLLIEKRKLR